MNNRYGIIHKCCFTPGQWPNMATMAINKTQGWNLLIVLYILYIKNNKGRRKSDRDEHAQTVKFFLIPNLMFRYNLLIYLIPINIKSLKVKKKNWYQKKRNRKLDLQISQHNVTETNNQLLIPVIALIWRLLQKLLEFWSISYRKLYYRVDLFFFSLLYSWKLSPIWWNCHQQNDHQNTNC